MVDLASGAVLAGHRIVSVIGRGGASTVYRAHHLRLDRDVALKILTPQLALDDGFRERFVRESRIAARLEHPHIVPVYDAGEADELLYLSMRLIDGPDLGRFLELRGGVIPVRATITLLSQIADALDAAHRRGLVHRDVKPGNILLEHDRDHDITRAFLSDFGIVKHVDGSTGPTRTGQVVGTADFVAPEQVQGRAVDGRADVYSLACVLYRCVSGAAPFVRATALATVYAHVNEAPPHLSSSPALDAVIQRGLAKDPDERFTTCGGLMRAAASALEDHRDTVEHVDDTLVDLPSVRSMLDRDERTEAWSIEDTPTDRVRRKRSLIAAIVAIVAVVAFTSVVTVVALTDPEPPAGSSGGNEPGATASADGRWSPASLMWQQVARGEAALRTSGSSAQDADVDGDAFTVVGYAGRGPDSDVAVWTSTGGVQWTRVSSEGLAEPGEQRMEGVTSVETGHVAVGWTYTPEGEPRDAAVWSRDDGGEWQRVWTDPVPEEQVMRDVTVVRGGLLAAGWDESLGHADAAVWFSEDGRVWERLADEALAGPGDERIYGLVRTSTGVVAVGNAATPGGTTDIAIWSSSDGRSWQRHTEHRPGYQRLTDVVPSPSGAIAVGQDTRDAAVWFGAGGEWSHMQLPVADYTSSDALAAVVLPEGYVVGGWVKGSRGYDAMIWTSSDGRTWTPADPGTPEGADLSEPGDQEIRGLIGLDEHERGIRVIAVGVSGVGMARRAAIWYGTSVS